MRANRLKGLTCAMFLFFLISSLAFADPGGLFLIPRAFYHEIQDLKEISPVSQFKAQSRRKKGKLRTGSRGLTVVPGGVVLYVFAGIGGLILIACVIGIVMSREKKGEPRKKGARK